MKSVCVAAFAVMACVSAAAADDFAEVDRGQAAWRGVFDLAPEIAGLGDILKGHASFEVLVGCADVETITTFELTVTAGEVKTGGRVVARQVEARDGRNLRFEYTRWLDNRKEAVQAGVASLGPDGATVTMTEPKPETRMLGDDVVFPHRHHLLVLAAARAGSVSAERKVFSGALEGPTSMMRIVGMERGRSANDPRLGPFADKPGWLFRKESRALDGASPGSISQIEEFLTEGGVSTSVRVTMSGIRMSGIPLSVQRLAKPECS